MSRRGSLTLQDSLDLLSACQANGSDLLLEARLLYEHRHYPRAFVLAQLAGEEFAKVQLLLGIATALAAGIDAPMDSFWKSWTDHDDKGTFRKSWNDILAGPSGALWVDSDPGEFTAAVPGLIKELAGLFGPARGYAKASSVMREDATYVDFRNSRVITPRSRVGRGRAKRKLDEVVVEEARCKTIVAANFAVLIEIPEAQSFLNSSVRSLFDSIAEGELFPKESKPSTP